MDQSYDAPECGSSEEEWMDLSKSDYAKVIFSNLYWNSGSGDVGCLVTPTETVSKNPSDYVGIYKVGYDSLSQCLAMKRLSEFQWEDDSKPLYCGFKSEELPELNGFYQFLYVTHEKEVCGASMPFEVKKREEEVVVTERIENDFLMVRYGLEQKNYKLETLLKTYEAENVVLVAKIRELRGEKTAATQQLEEIEPRLNAVQQELKQLKEEHLVLAKNLKFTKDNEANVLGLLDKETKKVSEMLQRKEELENMYEKALAENRNISAEFEETMKERDILMEELTKTVDELKEELKFKQIFIEKIIQESFDLTKAQDVTLEEYKKRIEQLEIQIEKLTADLITKEKSLKDQWSNEKEQKFNLMEIDLQNALSQKNASEMEIARLRRYLRNPQEYTKCSTSTSSHMTTATKGDAEEFLQEQLNDAKFMIKALEDSKQLAMKEMHALSEKLKKTKEETSQLRCENIALKIFLEEQSSCTNLLSKLKESDPIVDMDNLESKVMDSILQSQQQTKEIDEGKVEINLLKCENMALKLSLEEKTNHGTASGESTKKEVSTTEKKNSDKEILADNLFMNLLPILKESDPTADMDNMQEKFKELVKNAQHQAGEIRKLKEECKMKDDEIGLLNEKMTIQKRITLDAIMNVEDKTARIVQAAELYKDLYKEKEKLAKQLRKLMLMKSRSKKTPVSSNTQDCLKPGFLALNIEKALTCSETTSNNSDSDTGEHVRVQRLYPDLEKDEMPQVQTTEQTEVAAYPEECNSLNATINYLYDAIKDDQVYKAPPKTESLSLQQSLTVEEDTHIPCSICGTSFLITPYSNIPMIEHIEREHNMDVCPLCGQMFDKSFPSKYLKFHINDHFQSE